MNQDKKVEFKLPQGFSMPEGKGAGDTIEIMATLELKDGGSACLTKLGDAPMPGYDSAADKDQAPPDKSEFISSYLNQMGGAGGGGAPAQTS